MSNPRPNPLTIINTMRGAAADYRDLRTELAGSGGGATDRITGGDEDRLPVDEALFDLLWEVDQFGAHYARVLMNETHDWRPPSKGGTPTMLEALALRIGHFTAHEDEQFAWAFAEDLTNEHGTGVADRLKARARPSGKRPVPLGVACQEPECGGEYRVILDINPDAPVPEDMMFERLKRKDAWCDKQRHHVMRVELMQAVRRYETLREVMG